MLKTWCLREAVAASCSVAGPYIYTQLALAFQSTSICPPPQLDENRLHGEVPLPLREAWELGCVDLESVSTSLSTVQHEVPVRSVRLRRAG